MGVYRLGYFFFIFFNTVWPRIQLTTSHTWTGHSTTELLRTLKTWGDTPTNLTKKDVFIPIQLKNANTIYSFYCFVPKRTTQYSWWSLQTCVFINNEQESGPYFHIQCLWTSSLVTSRNKNRLMSASPKRKLAFHCTFRTNESWKLKASFDFWFFFYFLCRFKGETITSRKQHLNGYQFFSIQA